MFALLLDPRIFNYVILALFLMSAGRWAFDGSWVNALYWFSAFTLNAAVTFGYQR